MLILIDSNENTDREKNRDDKEDRADPSNIRAMERLKKYFGKKVQPTSLASGDINVMLEGGKVLSIERKRAGDFLGSIGNGRIFRQVENMAAKADWSCVIVEGLLSFDADDMTVIPIFDKDDKIARVERTQWRGGSVRGAMYAIQWSGCPIITIEPSSLPMMVEDLAKFCAKPAEHSRSLGRHRYVTFPQLTLTEEIISSFPGVGLKRTRALIEFAKEQNDNQVPTLAESFAWASTLGRIQKKYRPEGWGDMTITNFRATLGLQEGEVLDIKQEEKEDKPKQQKGGRNGK